MTIGTQAPGRPHKRSAGAVPTRPRPRGAQRKQAQAGYWFSSLYVLLLCAFGIFPAGYALYLAFVRPEGGFALFDNFITVFNDYRYADTFAHIGLYAVAYLVPTMVLSVGLALLLQSRRPMVSQTFRFMYYLPHSVIGVAAVLLWLFMLTPSVSPVGGLLRMVGFDSLFEIVSPTKSLNLAIVFAAIAVWTSGQGILLMFAALTSIPREVEEAARIDGANAWQAIWHVRLPMIRKWLAYLFIINIAASTQLFAEPQLMAAVTNQAVGNNWSPLQLAYTFAWQYGNFPASAALAVQLLIIGVAAAVLVVKRTDLFKVEI